MDKPDEFAKVPIDAEAHRRLLMTINQARRVEDLEFLREAKIDKEQLRQLLRVRDRERPQGFAHLREVAEFARIDRDLLVRIIWWFGPWRFGSWSMPYETETPEGAAFHVAHAAVL